MTVAQPSTPASYFHLLRRHAYLRPRHPLIVFTPKSMLRAGRRELRRGSCTRPVRARDSRCPRPPSRYGPASLLVSGKLYWELLKHLGGDGSNIALVRLEQYYPLPAEQIGSSLARFPTPRSCGSRTSPVTKVLGAT